ncbi:MAG TPA: sulfotransferase [Nocardioidaceae bacterium]|nr:sulfotransferase [Nocardioidaceae bacterium]
MSHRVFLHVGLPKSGTTYLQAVLGKNKSLLRQHGALLYPGETWSRQVDAVRDVRRMKLPPSQKAVVAGAWDRLVAEMEAWPKDSIVSMEWLCMATPGQIQRIVKDLEPAEVHVVFTVRDVARTVPAAWQEFSQNRSTWRWPEFLQQVTGDQPMETSAGKAFWGQQDMEQLLERWASIVPSERVHVVTLPQSGADPSELWRRMCQVLGIDPSGYDLTDLGSNASLGMESAELMRRVNERLREQGLPVPVYNKVFKHKLAKKTLASRKSQETKVLLPVEYHDWARSRAEQQIQAIKTSGSQVVGDLEELRPVLKDSGDVQVVATEPPADAVLEAAVEALVAVALERQRRRKRQAAPNQVAPREGLMRRVRLDWMDRVRGRSPKELAAAALRRVRRTPGSEH